MQTIERCENCYEDEIEYGARYCPQHWVLFLNASKIGTPLEGTATCAICGKDVFPDLRGYCAECDEPLFL